MKLLEVYTSEAEIMNFLEKLKIFPKNLFLKIIYEITTQCFLSGNYVINPPVLLISDTPPLICLQCLKNLLRIRINFFFGLTFSI